MITESESSASGLDSSKDSSDGTGNEPATLSIVKGHMLSDLTRKRKIDVYSIMYVSMYVFMCRYHAHLGGGLCGLNPQQGAY